MARKKRPKRGGGKVQMAPGERLAAALKLHQAGDVPGAVKAYAEMLEVLPDHPTLLHFLGMGQIQMRQFDEGEANVRRALERDPTYPDAWNSLGNLYRLTGRPQEALEAYQRVTELEPTSIPGWVNLGDLYRATRNPEGAQRALERAVELTETGTEHSSQMRFRVFAGLASVKRLNLEWEEAAKLYERALKLEPGDGRIRRDLIGALYNSGQHDRAAELAREWIAREPDDMLARRVHASITDIGTPERTADDEVAMLFDRYAPQFDESLANLEYRAPGLLQQAVEAVLGPGSGTLDACDAGCGTGLVGLWLKGYARSMVGVDLSQGMLDLARERKVYDRLDRAELTEWLSARQAEFDLIVCADTLCYFGSLAGFCAAAFRAARPGALLAFTVEYREEPSANGYHLQLNGRYTHNEDYVRRCLAEPGFNDIRADIADLRLEMGQPVRGLVVTARRP